MYPYIRTARVLLAARLGARVGPDQESLIQLRIWLGDIDIFLELNNGRFLTLMDLGRLDLGMRSGLIAVLHRQRWGLTVGGASVRFRHRVRLFDRVALRTTLIGHDERWFYFDQTIERGDRVCAGALVRAGITSEEGLVPPERVLEAMGHPGWARELPIWARAWIEAESQRPWPPRPPRED